jgi:pilus assembly protein Flp/PilA
MSIFQLLGVSKMNKFLASIKSGIASFAREEEGAQIVEYALIIAVVSIALVIALSALGGTHMTTFVSRVTACLTTATCV